MFHSQGLLFREVEHHDLSILRDWRNDHRMSAGWSDPRSVQTMQNQEDWYKTLGPNHQAFMVQDEARGELIGLLRLKPDPVNRRAALTGTDVSVEFQGQGYGKKILRAGAEHLILKLGYHRVTAEAMASNLSAIKIIESCGFIQEGILRQYVWRNGKWHDWFIYALLEGELK